MQLLAQFSGQTFKKSPCRDAPPDRTSGLALSTRKLHHPRGLAGVTDPRSVI
jgi:hypothetical protein